MIVAVAIAVHNEEMSVGTLLEALLRQTRLPDEIVVVDDGSTDGTAAVVKSWSKNNHRVRYLYQPQAGPAAARNKAWRSSHADVYAFTDGDCVPEAEWLETLLDALADPGVGAAGGTYKTLNRGSVLARFVGLEIAWRYRDVRGEVDVHGTYSLAVRRAALVEVGGFSEEYPAASGEDWDVTHRISRRHKIIFAPSAVVGHYHPERLWPYLRGQARRGADRVRVYRDHPEIRGRDTYTPWYVKYQVLAAGGVIPSAVLLYPFRPWSYLVPGALALFVFSVGLAPVAYLIKRDTPAALYGIVVQFCRSFAWSIGLVQGIAGAVWAAVRAQCWQSCAKRSWNLRGGT